jgi:hypothetical protein
MNLRSTPAILALAFLIQSAEAAFPALQEAYEVSAADVTLPTNEFGSVILRECPSCDRVTLRVADETLYVFGGQVLALRQFREFVLNMDDRDAAVTTIIYRLEDRRVSEIRVSPAPQEPGGPLQETRG